MIDHDLIRARELKPPKGRGFWVFAYGSLMWRPGFDFIESRPALLVGYHRAFCIVSTHYRGTAKKPGLVLGLDRGGACRGRAYRIAAGKAKKVARYLHEREMVNSVYEPRWLTAATPRGKIRAVAYVADRGNPEYVGKLPLRRAAKIIRDSAGISGTNRDYLAQTVRHLDELGIADGLLHRLLRLVEGKRRASGVSD